MELFTHVSVLHDLIGYSEIKYEKTETVLATSLIYWDFLKKKAFRNTAKKVIKVTLKDTLNCIDLFGKIMVCERATTWRWSGCATESAGYISGENQGIANGIDRRRKLSLGEMHWTTSRSAFRAVF